MICSVCKNKQSSFISDYPLARHLDYRVCAKCQEKLESIQKDRTSEDAQEYIKYFRNLIESGDYPSDIKEFFDVLLKNNVTSDDITEAISAEKRSQLDSITLTSGYNFEGYRIDNYINFISSETGLGMGFFKAIYVGVANIGGIESKSIRQKLKSAKDSALDDLKEQAYNLGANAIIGTSLDYTMFGDSLVGVIVSGTAVRISKI